MTKQMDTTSNQSRVLMTGNEAIARGVYEAGVHFAAAYPGTPSTEILENVATYPEIHAEWAPNEKVAVEFVIGCATAGARAFACMKHVGMNVAADPLMTVSYGSTIGGLVILTADEPGMHSSQNEQDNRNYAKMARMPLLEPSTSQECKDMVKLAYQIFDEFGQVVMMRMTTRVCHSKSIVTLCPREEVAIKPYVKDTNRFICVPANARKLRVSLEARLDKLKEYTNNCSVNTVEDNGRKIGVIASGMCYNYAKEVWGDNANYLKLGLSFPIPEELINSFVSKLDKVYVIEENDEYIEQSVRALGHLDICYGKYAPSGSRFLPAYGELTPDVIKFAVDGITPTAQTINKDLIVPRPPALCAGCPHRGLFYSLGKRKNVVIAGDIGCYTLGFAPPYNAMDFNNCMGASVSSGAGMQQAFNKVEGNVRRVVSVIGDSTFFHSGMTSLLEVVYNKSNNITVILDNRITGMTGHQQNPGTGFTLQNEPTSIANIEDIVKALGITRIKSVNPNVLGAVDEALDWAFNSNEASVIITRFPCLLKKFSELDKKEFPTAFTTKCTIDANKCVGCKMCLKSGCPALCVVNKKATINSEMCVGCQVCKQICKFGAIE
ncbi:MAG: indolepyruvate ferredoxin oxidoreductase subunit alpha [Clostridia bacterium]